MDGFAYESPPLKAEFTVHVTYKIVGRMQPLPYPIDE
jgi:hypothetical protein